MILVKLKPLIVAGALSAAVLCAGLAQAQEDISALKGHDRRAPIEHREPVRPTLTPPSRAAGCCTSDS